ncbi:MAG TPA: gluconeogenesis factor YvcK family protein [Coriobacteriia bacterium]|nr:gluconeogenesis factor YvcK family protein [Coriobacteriia bacterium]
MTSDRSRKAVAIGGGTGLPAVLGSLLDLGFDTSAVVTMADDGGSSGALRRELGMLPPGDVRNCLVAMAKEPDGLAARMLQYRFLGGEGLAGHALGNLMIAALTDIAGDFPSAIDAIGEYLQVRGNVLPSTLQDVLLHGVDRAGKEVFGQARLAANPSPVACAFLEPAAPAAYPPALEAISSADVIVIGPGSLYTSIIPNFLVAGIAERLCGSSALRVYVCNVANMRGETHGLDAADHVEALFEHGLAGGLDVALVHSCAGVDRPCGEDADPVRSDGDNVERIEALGVRVVLADLADPTDPVRHSRSALIAALREVLV